MAVGRRWWALAATVLGLHSASAVGESGTIATQGCSLLPRSSDDALTFNLHIKSPIGVSGKLEGLLLERSNPRSPLFGCWLSAEELQALSAHTAEDTAILFGEFASKSIRCEEPSRDVHMVTCEAASISTVDGLLESPLLAYSCGGIAINGVTSPSEGGIVKLKKGLSSALDAMVDGISGLSLAERLLAARLRQQQEQSHLHTRATAGGDAGNDQPQAAAGAARHLAQGSSSSYLMTSTLETIKRQYNFPTTAAALASTVNATALAAAGGVAHLVAQFVDPAIDISTAVWDGFLRQNDVSVSSRISGFAKVLGTPPSSNGATTADSAAARLAYLVPEWTSGLAGGVASNWLYAAGAPITTGLVPMLQSILSMAVAGEQLPSVITITASAPESSFGDVAITQANTALMSLGLLGVSLVVSSGDSGANSAGVDQCGRLVPSFPASSPWVLSVGATMASKPTPILPNPSSIGCIQPPFPKMRCAGVVTEIAASILAGATITSGGGFSASSVQPMPAWQQAAVQQYLNISAGSLPPSYLFDTRNRAYPDVSAIGHACLGWAPSSNGGPFILDGSACAASVWGAVLTLIAAAKKSLGQPAMGFVNPTLYAQQALYPSRLLRDVKEGSNNCLKLGSSQLSVYPADIPTVLGSSTLCPASCYGFNAAPGWDPVTGLGTPDVGDLLFVLTYTPAPGRTFPSQTPSPGPAAYILDAPNHAGERPGASLLARLLAFSLLMGGSLLLVLSA